LFLGKKTKKEQKPRSKEQANQLQYNFDIATTLKLTSPSSVNGYIGGSRYVRGWIRFYIKKIHK